MEYLRQNKYLLTNLCKGIIESGDKNAANSYLWAAAKEGLAEIVDKLIKLGIGVNVIDHLGRTPLFMAVENGHVEVVKIFIKAGAQINPKGNIKCAPLHMAIKNGSAEIVDILLKAGAIINLKQNISNIAFTCLRAAIINGHKDVIYVLIKEGIGLKLFQKLKLLPLVAANGHFDLIKFLVKQGIDINQEDSVHSTALISAVEHGHYDIVKYLILEGANIDQINQYGYSPLSMALEKQNFNIVYTLLGSGAYICRHPVDEDIVDPLHIAIERGYLDIVKLILDVKEDINAVVSKLDVPLTLAASGGKIDVIRYFLQMEPNVKIDYKHKLLRAAISNKKWDIVKLLLIAEAAYDEFVQNSFYSMEQERCQTIVKSLVEYGVNPQILNTILILAVRCGSDEITRVLLDAGANADLRIHGEAILEICLKLFFHVQTNPALKFCYANKHLHIAALLVQYTLLDNTNATKPKCKFFKLPKLWDQCQMEVRAMEKQKLGKSNLTVLGFLKEANVNQLAKYISDKDLEMWPDLEYILHFGAFPHYSQLIRYKVMLGQERLCKLQKVLLLTQYTNLARVPEDVRKIILQYIPNLSMDKLLEVFEEDDDLFSILDLQTTEVHQDL